MIERYTAKKRLISGEIRFIFVVDIYNEGVDIPEVNTVLFLRPTESLTIFLQQLGRGLRLAEGKECLTVLDFIGQANKKYNFEDKFAALLSNTTHSVQREIKDGFVNLPKGCYIQLEARAPQRTPRPPASAISTTKLPATKFFFLYESLKTTTSGLAHIISSAWPTTSSMMAASR